MVSQHTKASITDSIKESESIRNITRDYFTQAARLFTPKNNRPSCVDHDREKFDNGMNRYYQIKVNSLIDSEHDDIDYIVKLSEKNVNCVKCGTTKKFTLRKRRTQNKSDKRKYCKYLRTLCDRYCDSCYSTYHRRKLFGRLQIIDKLQQQQQSISPPSQPARTKKKRNSKKRHIEADTTLKSETIVTETQQCKTSIRPENQGTTTTTSQTVDSTAKHSVPKHYKPSQAKTKPKLVKLPPSKIKSQAKPQFSSRLRSFSCLLEE